MPTFSKTCCLRLEPIFFASCFILAAHNSQGSIHAHSVRLQSNLLSFPPTSTLRVFVATSDLHLISQRARIIHKHCDRANCGMCLAPPCRQPRHSTITQTQHCSGYHFIYAVDFDEPLFCFLRISTSPIPCPHFIYCIIPSLLFFAVLCVLGYRICNLRISFCDKITTQLDLTRPSSQSCPAPQHTGLEDPEFQASNKASEDRHPFQVSPGSTLVLMPTAAPGLQTPDPHPQSRPGPSPAFKIHFLPVQLHMS